MGGDRVSPLFCPAPPVGRVALVIEACLKAGVKSSEEIMEILEAFDLMGTVRGTTKLADCDHKTVAHWVRGAWTAGGGLPIVSSSRLWGGRVLGENDGGWTVRTAGSR